MHDAAKQVAKAYHGIGSAKNAVIVAALGPKLGLWNANGEPAMRGFLTNDSNNTGFGTMSLENLQKIDKKLEYCEKCTSRSLGYGRRAL